MAKKISHAKKHVIKTKKKSSKKNLYALKRKIKSKVEKTLKTPKIKEFKTPNEVKMEEIKKRIQEKVRSQIGGKFTEPAPVEIEHAKGHRKGIHEKTKLKEKEPSTSFLKTGITGFDELLEDGIPKGNSVLVVGGPGTGKTIFCLQMVAHAAMKGQKCLYISFEEPETRLKEHMKTFGWDADTLEKKGLLKIKRMDPFDITRSVEAMLEKSKGELMINIDPIDIPRGFKPDIIVVDSLSAIASAFIGKEESYRLYVEYLFKFFERYKATNFLISEIVELANNLTEEFMADGVIVFYYLKNGNLRERAIEVLKLRGSKHKEKIVAFRITQNGIVVYPDQEIFGA